MRVTRLLTPLLIAMAVAACARQQAASYVLDPSTGQPVPVVQQYAPPQYGYAQAGYSRLQAAPQPIRRPTHSRKAAVFTMRARATPRPATRRPIRSRSRNMGSRAAAVCSARTTSISRAAGAGCSIRNTAPSSRNTRSRNTRSSPILTNPTCCNIARPPPPMPTSRRLTVTAMAMPTRIRTTTRATRSAPATSCAWWCSASKASAAATRSTPAAMSRCRSPAPSRRAASPPTRSPRKSPTGSSRAMCASRT